MQRTVSDAIQRESHLSLADITPIILTIPINNTVDYSSIIKTYRKKHGLTQQELAEQVGIKFVTLRAWEQGRATPHYCIWRKIKDSFNSDL